MKLAPNAVNDLNFTPTNLALAWITTFAQMISVLLLCASCMTPAGARGGHVHGIGGFGLHEGHGMGVGRGGELLAPAYVLISISKITDEDAFKAAIKGLMAENPPFVGRIAVDNDKPVAWEGTSPEHVVMIQFDNADQGQAWKDSDAFKSFDLELHKSSEATIQFLRGQPTPTARAFGRGRRGGFDQKAFEPNVKEYDQMLNSKLHSICKGC